MGKLSHSEKKEINTSQDKILFPIQINQPTTAKLKNLIAENVKKSIELLAIEYKTVKREDYSPIVRYFDSEDIKKRLVLASTYASELLNNLPKIKDANTGGKSNSSEKSSELYKYHNKAHTFEQVVPWAMTLASQHAKMVGMKQMKGNVLLEQDKELLFLAAAFHDIWFLDSPVNNESQWAFYAELIMKKLKYDSKLISRVKHLIMATAHQHKPKDVLEKILCDADLAHLADPYEEFKDKAHRLYLEQRSCKIIPLSEKYNEWLQKEPVFLNRTGIILKLVNIY